MDFSLVKELREKTGVGLVKCKEALLEAKGDLEEAIVVLRKAGALSAAKRSDRITGEGYIGLAENESGLALVELNCETDFVAKTATFTEFANRLAQVTLEGRVSSVEELSQLSFPESSAISIEGERSSLVQKTGENIQIRRVLFFPKKAGHSYGVYPHLGNRAVGVVALLCSGQERLAKELAVHVVAFAPKFLSEKDVPQDILRQERDIGLCQAKEKPQAIAEKIAEGKVRDFLAQVCFLHQRSMSEPKLSVSEWIKREEKQTNASISVASFFCWRLLGE
ncbi:Translation elongation factor Ts [Candidatus Similichlamydia laticola]|uniref:Elongation factor Ts n=1 Tax=Candidatus Similichlamydia laticola TaxID=2170265 RepID=A0A369K9I4_9BACT|nr:Translation elongation factor Ts [Candidatus Similichlamydia laticola]